MIVIGIIRIYIDVASDEADCSEERGGVLCSEVQTTGPGGLNNQFAFGNSYTLLIPRFSFQVL